MRTILATLLLCVAPVCQAETVLVAVASNFNRPMQEIAAAFENSTGHSANLSFGASGKFAAQIENGAPFEVFLSADSANPEALEKSGLAVAGTRFTYTLGKLVLWSKRPGYVDAQGDVLKRGDFAHLAIADPKLAPYGAAAVATLQALGVYDKLQGRLVLGENIAQTQQFIDTGNAELGFVALSQVLVDGKIADGSGWPVPSTLHPPIRQDGVLLALGAENPAARALLDFLKSPQALAIIEKYGYGLAGGGQ